MSLLLTCISVHTWQISRIVFSSVYYDAHLVYACSVNNASFMWSMVNTLLMSEACVKSVHRLIKCFKSLSLYQSLNPALASFNMWRKTQSCVPEISTMHSQERITYSLLKKAQSQAFSEMQTHTWAVTISGWYTVDELADQLILRDGQIILSFGEDRCILIAQDVHCHQSLGRSWRLAIIRGLHSELESKK